MSLYAHLFVYLSLSSLDEELQKQEVDGWWPRALFTPQEHLWYSAEC